MSFSNTKTFSMEHIIGHTTYFNEDNAPYWLRYGGRQGSTMDNRWFWEDYILTLVVGQQINTDFNKITRIS